MLISLHVVGPCCRAGYHRERAGVPRGLCLRAERRGAVTMLYTIRATKPGHKPREIAAQTREQAEIVAANLARDGWAVVIVADGD